MNSLYSLYPMKHMACVTKGVAALPILLGLLAAESSAAITVYNNRSNFETALASMSASTQRFDENFGSFTVDTDYATQSIALSGFSIESFGNSDAARFKIDAPALTAKQEIDGTAYLAGNHQGTSRGYRFVFGALTLAWGGDFSDIENGTTGLALSDGTNLDLPNVGLSNTGFIGFISNVGITSLTSVGGGTGDQVGWDNVTTVSVVPEPSSALILGLGALGLVALRRRS